MSYILDALKKSERERTLVRGVGFGDASRRQSPYKASRFMWWIAGTAIFSLLLIVALLWWWRTVAPVPEPTAAAPVAPISEPLKDATPTMPPPVAAVSTPTPPPALQPVATGEAKYLTAMPSAFQSSVPGMTINIHVYADAESARILYINNRQFRRGDDVGGGVIVEEIIPDGVVFQFRGERFKLPRPS